MNEKATQKLIVIYGILPAMVIALAATTLHRVWPPAGAAVTAMFLGMGFRLIKVPPVSWEKGLQFTSKKLLKLAIILLGGSLNLMQLKTVGLVSFQVIFFTLTAAFLSARLTGKYLMKIGFNQRTLIAVGTGICGGSAIAALSPLLDADDEEIAFAISATFLFDIAGVILFPILGHLMGLSDMGYGLWTGTAVNDTSSVVAAGYAFSQSAGDYATMVKMARTTMILPIGILLNGAVLLREKKKENKNSAATRLHPAKLIPWFIGIFCLVVALNTAFPFSPAISKTMKTASAFIITSALAAIGLSTYLKRLLKGGLKPLILGGIVSLVVVIVSLIVQTVLGLL
jgi:uncharacterized integral membrane protein (TIGR00698 family)